MPANNVGDPVGPIALDSEFASARVNVDRHGNGPRLRIYDVRHGAEILLDPMDLVALANTDPDELSFLHVPPAVYGRASRTAAAAESG